MASVSRTTRYPRLANGVAGRPGCVTRGSRSCFCHWTKGCFFHPSIVKEITMKSRVTYVSLLFAVVVLGVLVFKRGDGKAAPPPPPPTTGSQFDQLINTNATQMVAQGRQTFRFDTFGDESFWGDTLM